MAESIVTDWINDFNALEPEELKTFAALHTENHELSTAIHTVLNDKSKHTEFLHSICNQLYNFYRSNENALKCFTLQFFPNLIFMYLNGIACGEKQNFRCVETLLLCAYNIEACNENGILRSVSFRMPVLAQPSIYHEEKNLHSSDLKRYEENINRVISWKLTQQVTKLNAQNRLDVMASLIFVFNQQISLIPKSAFYHLCKNSSKLAMQGFTKYGHSYRSSYGNDPMNTSISSASSSVSSGAPNKPTGPPRIPLSQQFLIELLHANYFAMFNEFASVAIQAVDDIHNRACYELFSDVILVTNAIKNSLQANPSGQPSDGPMGISALTPSTTTVTTVSKSMITNASFRTKKLPDDIPIQNDANVSSASTSVSNAQQQQLGSINEEQEGDTSVTKIGPHKSKEGVSKHKAFGGLKKLIDRDKDSKDKDKDKEKGEKGSEKMEKELSKAASAIKSGLSDTKENMKKLIGKDRQKSLQSMPVSSSTVSAAATVANHHDDSNQTSSHANNGDLKNSPLVLLKRSSEAVLATESVDMSVLNEKQFTFEATKGNESGGVNGGSHGIISPFDSINSDSESEVEHPHHQLSTSSSASVNIVMDTNSKTNVQVSQI